MQLRIHANSVRLSSSLRERIAGQVAAVLAPFDPSIQSVEVSLADINGRRGGVDKQCRIELRTARRSPLQVTDKASGIMAAVGLAARRAGFATPPTDPAVARETRQSRTGTLFRGAGV